VSRNNLNLSGGVSSMLTIAKEMDAAYNEFRIDAQKIGLNA
jgi:hypothetical protein